VSFFQSYSRYINLDDYNAHEGEFKQRIHEELVQDFEDEEADMPFQHREKLQEPMKRWFCDLDYMQRQIVLTVVDKPLVDLVKFLFAKQKLLEETNFNS
jgi:hypothetical protein